MGVGGGLKGSNMDVVSITIGALIFLGGIPTFLLWAGGYDKELPFWGVLIYTLTGIVAWLEASYALKIISSLSNDEWRWLFGVPGIVLYLWWCRKLYLNDVDLDDDDAMLAGWILAFLIVVGGSILSMFDP